MQIVFGLSDHLRIKVLATVTQITRKWAYLHNYKLQTSVNALSSFSVMTLLVGHLEGYLTCDNNSKKVTLRRLASEVTT